VSNPSLTWLRTLALALEHEGKMGVALIASEIVQTCELHGVEIPGLKDANEEVARRRVGCTHAPISGTGTLSQSRFHGSAQSGIPEAVGDLDSTPAYVQEMRAIHHSPSPPNGMTLTNHGGLYALGVLGGQGGGWSRRKRG
jgi:hypothetical protein